MRNLHHICTTNESRGGINYTHLAHTLSHTPNGTNKKHNEENKYGKR